MWSILLARIPTEITLRTCLIFLGLLAYWNLLFTLGRLWLCITWTIFTCDIYITFTFVLEGVKCLLRLPSQPIWAAVLEMPDLKQLLVSVNLLAIMTGDALNEWYWTIVTRTLLRAWLDCVTFWESYSSSLNLLGRLFTLLAVAVTVTCCTLQWSFYVTLPPEQLGNSAEQLLWYSSLHSCLMIGFEALLLGLTVVMQWFGFSVLVRLCEWCGLHTTVLDETLLDPFCEEYRLCLRYIYALFCVTSGIVYMPPSLPLYAQITILHQIHSAKMARRAYTLYRNLLHIFPSVMPNQPTTCGICLEEFKANERAKQLPCRHLFHAHCVRRWLVHNVLCPTCRQLAYSLSGQRQPTAHRRGGDAAQIPNREERPARRPVLSDAVIQLHHSPEEASPMSRTRVNDAVSATRPQSALSSRANGARSCLDHRREERHDVERQVDLSRCSEASTVPGHAAAGSHATFATAHITSMTAQGKEAIVDRLFVDEPLRLRARRGRRRRREASGAAQGAVDEGPPQRRSRK